MYQITGFRVRFEDLEPPFELPVLQYAETLDLDSPWAQFAHHVTASNLAYQIADYFDLPSNAVWSALVARPLAEARMLNDRYGHSYLAYAIVADLTGSAPDPHTFLPTEH